MRFFLIFLIVFAVLTTTLWQDRTVIWLDNWLVAARPETFVAPALNLSGPKLGQAAPDAYRPLGGDRRDHATAMDRAANAVRRQAELFDNPYFAAEMKAAGGGSVEYRLRQADVAGGEVRGEIRRDSASIGLHWPKRD